MKQIKLTAKENPTTLNTIVVPKFFTAAARPISKSEADETGADADRTLDFTISNADIDRDNDTIDAAGWVLDAYKANPVVLWAHDSFSPPVGKSLKVWVEKGALKSRDQFTSEEEYPFGAMIHRLYKGGYLNAVSVGFKALDWKFNDERGEMAMDFLKQELLEHSAVPVPANPGALLDAKAKGIRLAPLTEWAEKILDGEKGAGLWLPRKLIEQAWAESREKAPVTVEIPQPPASPAVEVVTDASKVEPKVEATAATKLIDDTLVKLGRVLSAANENRLVRAKELLDEVLNQLEAADVDDDKDYVELDEGDEEEIELDEEDEGDDLDGVDPDELRKFLHERLAALKSEILQSLTGRVG